jgi:hypothetical protein
MLMETQSFLASERLGKTLFSDVLWNWNFLLDFSNQVFIHANANCFHKLRYWILGEKEPTLQNFSDQYFPSNFEHGVRVSSQQILHTAAAF